MGYKFDKDKYMTNTIQENLPVELQIFLWECIENLIRQDIELDYLQIFVISSDKKTISILHSQEQPIPFENRYESLNEVIAGLITENLKIYVIDNIEYSTMLFANEY